MVLPSQLYVTTFVYAQQHQALVREEFLMLTQVSNNPMLLTSQLGNQSREEPLLLMVLPS